MMKSLLALGLLVGWATPAFSVTKEEVIWHNGDIELHGTLYLPDSEGPHPVFIFLHGSGAESRKGFFYHVYARQFANNGIAMLVYDKRGTEESTGDWRVALYEDLAQDAVKGIEMLSKRDDIGAGFMGVIGQSEGGWTGTLTSIMSPHVGLFIMNSGPAVSPYEQSVYSLSNRLREKGISERDIAEAAEFKRLRNRTQMSEVGWEEFDRALEVARERSWYEAAGKPGRPNRKTPGVRIWNYDPIPALKQLQVPVLAMFGGGDVLVNAGETIQILNEMKAKEGKDFTIHLYPGSRHNLTTNGLAMPEGHWDRIFNWIEENAPVRKESRRRS